jgi:hypothetical protein
MLETWWLDLTRWWSALTPELAFLFALPFGVALVAWLGALWRARQRARQRQRHTGHGRPGGPTARGTVVGPR